MRIKLTNPDNLEKVIDKLDQLCPLVDYNESFIRYCIPSLKERLAKGEIIYLDSEIVVDYGVIHQELSYWSPSDISTDEEYLKNGL